MAAPQLSSSDPAHGSVDNVINRPVTLTFAEAVDSSTVTVNSFTLTDLNRSSAVDVSAKVSPTNSSVVVVSPFYQLAENTTYRLIIVGENDAITDFLKSADGTSLTSSIVVEFTTGDNVWQIDTTLEKEAQSLTLEGDLFLPSNVKALGFDFTITKVAPDNHTHGVPQNITGDNTIRFFFSRDLMTGQQYADWVDIDVFPLLDDTRYLASGNSLGGTIPAYTVTATGQNLDIVFSGELPQNAGVHLELLDKIQSLSGDLYGGKMIYKITTELYPTVFGIQSVRREVGAAGDSIFDDYIGSLLFKNTIELWEHTGRGLDLSDLSWPARKHILYSTVLDIIEDKDYEKFLEAGTRNAWADRFVHIENLIGRLAQKIATLTRKKEIAWETIFKGWSFQTAVKSERDCSIFRVSRLWESPRRYGDPACKYYWDSFPYDPENGSTCPTDLWCL